MRSHPMNLTGLLLIPITLLVVAAGCAQWSPSVAESAATRDGAAESEAGERIVISGNGSEALSRAQANAIANFNRDTLAAMGVESEMLSVSAPAAPSE